MRVGITGSRYGMNENQRKYAFSLINRFLVTGSVLHHGDCLGVDQEVAIYAKQIGYRLICHPPIKSKMRAFCESHEYRDKYDYTVRDRHIVDESDVLIAVPNTMSYKKGSGTWMTYNYAKRMNVPAFLILPDLEYLYD